MKSNDFIPPIGKVVFRITPTGLQKDWCYMTLYIVGKDDKGRPITESGVVCWGSTGERRDRSKYNNWVDCFNGKPVLE